MELATVSSNYHLELNPSEAGRKDVHIVQEVIKEMAKTKSSTSMFQDAASSFSASASAAGASSQGKEGASASTKASATYKVLLINEVDRLSRHAQHALRRTMEKYSKQCRLVMTCTNLSKVIDPVQSRCVCVRVKVSIPLQTAQDIWVCLCLALCGNTSRSINHSFENLKTDEMTFLFHFIRY